LRMRITMPYSGKNLSCNYYKIVGRGGRPTNCTKPDVKKWMKDLEDTVREHPDYDEFLGNPVLIKLAGRFVDERCPDLSNLHKVISDSVSNALGSDDKTYRFLDLGYTTGHAVPRLEIEVVLI